MYIIVFLYLCISLYVLHMLPFIRENLPLYIFGIDQLPKQLEHEDLVIETVTIAVG